MAGEQRRQRWTCWALSLVVLHSMCQVRPAICFLYKFGTKSTTFEFTVTRHSRAHQSCTNDVDSSKSDTEIINADFQVSRSRFLRKTAAALITSSASASTSTPNCAAHQARTTTTTATPTVPSPPLSITTFNAAAETLQESISGFAAGGALTITKTLVKYPLDTATVRLQMPATKYTIRDPLTLFADSFDGVTVPLITNVPAGGVFFAVRDAAKSWLKANNVPKWTRTVLAVAAAQFPYWLVRNPSEVVKTRQQAGVPGYGEGVSALEAFRLVWEESEGNNSTAPLAGMEGFYSGYLENILYAYPADVIKFVSYDTITQGKKNLAPLDGAVAGAISTAIAQLVTTPLDVVRNRVMAGEAPDNEETLGSYIDSLRTLAREEGVKGLFAGASPRVGKAVLSGAIQFATYEETKQTINGLLDRRGLQKRN